jgi:hypothetical protein
MDVVTVQSGRDDYGFGGPTRWMNIMLSGNADEALCAAPD